MADSGYPPSAPSASAVESSDPSPPGHFVERGSDSEDEDEKILETSENKRWNKMSVQVSQREVPGIDAAYLAMDTEEGMEVVWNEVRLSQRKTDANKGRLGDILSKLIKVKHRNIVTFYDFWLGRDAEHQDRLVFITEYMTSGSLLQFLKTKKRNTATVAGEKSKKASKDTPWKRWCRQILSALCYLHKKDIVHGNLTLGTIFIQHDGLVKIGAVSPDAIHQHVKTKNEDQRWLHYIAPEYASTTEITPAADIYAFGLCMLEMVRWDMLDSTSHPMVKPDMIKKALESLEPPRRIFIQSCLNTDPSKRPQATELLRSPILREVVPLRNLAALKLPIGTDVASAQPVEFEACVKFQGQPKSVKSREKSLADVSRFVEEIRRDLAMHEPDDPTAPPPTDATSEVQKKRRAQTKYNPEARRVQTVGCELRCEGEKKMLHIRLLFDDKLKRNLTTELKEGDLPEQLAKDLVTNGLVNENDLEEVSSKIAERVS